MKKILLLVILFFGSISSLNAEISRIVSGNKNAKITIIAYESLTCSHCANFHKDIYPQLKKEYIDTGLAKIEFRHFPLDIAALNASKITQCKKDQSLEILESLYSNQQAWLKGGTIEEVNDNLKKFLKKEDFNIDFEKKIPPKETIKEKNMTNNRYKKKINDVKNEKIKKSLLELTKVFKEK